MGILRLYDWPKVEHTGLSQSRRRADRHSRFNASRPTKWPRVLCRGRSTAPHGLGHQIFRPIATTIAASQRQGRAHPSCRSGGIPWDKAARIHGLQTSRRSWPSGSITGTGIGPIRRWAALRPHRPGFANEIDKTPLSETVEAAYDRTRERIRIADYRLDKALDELK